MKDIVDFPVWGEFKFVGYLQYLSGYLEWSILLWC